jgi:hypothetical protein
MSKYWFALVAALAGCVTQPQVVVTEKPPERVEIPVAQRCIDAKDIPAPPKTAMKPAGDVKQRAAGAAVDLYALEKHAEDLRVLLLECAK